jgi:multidrug transporter EmrE-like cation transporter
MIAKITAAVIGAILLTVADMSLRSATDWRAANFWVAALLYVLSVIPAFYAFRQANFRIIFNVWACAAVLLSVFAAKFWYGEVLTLRQYAASGCVLTAMLLEN